MRFPLLVCVALAGCGSRVDRALTLLDDAAYVEARGALVLERCVGLDETPQCALAHALAADGLGDSRTRDGWVERAELLSRRAPLRGLEMARLRALERRVSWERQVDQLRVHEAGRGTTD
jgi:hypothetical protein